MLGFAPLAAAPLGDDGAIVVYDLTAGNITTGAPTIGASTLAQDHDLNLNGITRLGLGDPGAPHRCRGSVPTGGL